VISQPRVNGSPMRVPGAIPVFRRRCRLLIRGESDRAREPPATRPPTVSVSGRTHTPRSTVFPQLRALESEVLCTRLHCEARAGKRHARLPGRLDAAAGPPPLPGRGLKPVPVRAGAVTVPGPPTVYRLPGESVGGPGERRLDREGQRSPVRPPCLGRDVQLLDRESGSLAPASTETAGFSIGTVIVIAGVSACAAGSLSCCRRAAAARRAPVVQPDDVAFGCSGRGPAGVARGAMQAEQEDGRERVRTRRADGGRRPRPAQ